MYLSHSKLSQKDLDILVPLESNLTSPNSKFNTQNALEIGGLPSQRKTTQAKWFKGSRDRGLIGIIAA